MALTVEGDRFFSDAITAIEGRCSGCI